MMKTNIVLLCLLALVMAAPAVVAQDANLPENSDSLGPNSDSLLWVWTRGRAGTRIPWLLAILTSPVNWVSGSGGEARVELEILIHSEFGALTVEIAEVRGFVYNGAQTWRYTWKPDFDEVDTLDLVVPSRDTCSMLIVAYTEEARDSAWACWVPTDHDRFRFVASDPKLLKPPTPPVQKWLPDPTESDKPSR